MSCASEFARTTVFRKAGSVRMQLSWVTLFVALGVGGVLLEDHMGKEVEGQKARLLRDGPLHPKVL